MSAPYLRCNGCASVAAVGGLSQIRAGEIHGCDTRGAWQLVTASDLATTPETTLRDVIGWANEALNFMAYNLPANDASQKAMAAVHHLTILARRALPSPSPDELRWALRNDPLCAAAYAHGRHDRE